jgi:hypothetical protein
MYTYFQQSICHFTLTPTLSLWERVGVRAKRGLKIGQTRLPPLG